MNHIRALLILAASAVSTAVDPVSYFGGTDNGTYLDWLSNTSYDHNAWLGSSSDATLGVSVHWSTDSTHIQLAVAAKASGWVGFGLAESGSMRGADIIMFSAESNELVDSYVLEDLVTPIPDDCQSWTLVNSVSQDGFIIFEASRLLDTGDTQDKPFTDDSNELVAASRVIAAWGDTSAPTYHGFTNRAKGSIRFMGAISVTEMELFQKSVTLEAEGNFTIAADNHEIAAVETKYDFFCFSGANLTAMGVPIDEDLHVIGIEPVVDPSSSRYVHHFVVSGTNDPWDSRLNCAEYPGFEMVYVWAPGDMPLRLPDNVGGPLGLAGFRSFRLEIHYNNPELDAGKIDSSGVRFHFTSKKRQYDLGVFQTGDPRLALRNITLSNDTALSEHSFDCLNSCSALFLNESVTVISEHLHMHKAGISMKNSQSRGNQVVRVGEVQFWDFDQQGNLGVVQAPFTIQPGDSFRTTCNYKTNNGEVFGLGSSDEMCIAFLFYYPRKALPSEYGDIPFMCGPKVFGDFLPDCDASWTRADLQDTSELGRTFGVAASSCPEPTPANFPSPSPNAPSAPSAPPSSAADQKWNWYMTIPMVLAWVGGHTFA
ncbi:copper type II ascorbate-dependent monooxygenase [Fragilaria crotonensis]|nr:copper type II ascorbate-dependent monooxygenase [Fragilaria crotonensis]